MIQLTQKDVLDVLGLIKLTMPSLVLEATKALNDSCSWKIRKLWGVYKDKMLVQCCGFYGDEVLWMSWFAVSPEIQGNGHGKKMLDFLTAECKDNVLYVETYLRPEFASANAFYIKNGFTFYGFVLPDIIQYQRKIKK